jgi:putative oxidoreductase
MKGWLTRTVDSFGPTFVRLFLGGVMFPHGAQKMFGWFGGSGWAATLKYFQDNLQIPLALGIAAIITEFVGSICLILGFWTRLWALGMGILISVAAYKVHWVHGFWMNWFGKQKGEGIEYHLLVLGMSLGLLCLGGGNLSIDKLFSRKGEKREKKQS